MSDIFDCISIGSATVDVIIKSNEFKVTKNKEYKTGLAICEMYGSKTNIDDFYVGSGGGATNSSCSLSNLGLKTSCISIIANDAFSEYVIDDLVNFKVDIDNLIIKKGKKTAFSAILTAPDGGRTALVYRGNFNNLKKQNIENLNLNTKWVYLTNLGGSSKDVIEVIDFLKQKGIKICWNPGINEIKDLNISNFPQVDILSLNSEEAGTLLNINLENTKDIIKELKKLKVKLKILTLGEKGAFCLENEIYHVQSYKVKVENTIGAGDAFGSGFLYAIIKNYDIETALEYGIKNSVSVIQKTGAKEGFLNNLNNLPKPKIHKIK